MFDIGFAELFLLSLIGLMVLGPERLPGVARTIGGFVRKARISYHNLKRTVEAELAAAEAANPVREAQKELESVQRQVNELKGQLDQTMTPSIGPEKEIHDPERPQGALDEASEPSESSSEPPPPESLSHEKPDAEADESALTQAVESPEPSGKAPP